MEGPVAPPGPFSHGDFEISDSVGGPGSPADTHVLLGQRASIGLRGDLFSAGRGTPFTGVVRGTGLLVSAEGAVEESPHDGEGNAVGCGCAPTASLLS